MIAWCHLPTIFKRRSVLLTAGILTLCAALITTLFFANISYAQQSTTRTLNFQGRLQSSSGAVVPDGHYNMQFKIYQGGTGTSAGNPGGTLKWTETYINNGGTDGIEVKNGFFSVSLGSNNPFGTSVDWDNDTLFLSMNVAGTSTACTTYGTAPCSADGEMLPMKRITATPYAINAGAVGGKTVDQLIQNTTTLQSGSIALQSANNSDVTAYIEGRNGQTASNVVIKQGTSQTGKAIDIQDSSGSSVFNIDSTGTLNQTGDATIGGNLGVGTTTPSRPLDVAVSNDSVTTLPVRIAQNGTGDTGIELSTVNSGRYAIGIDATDGSFKVASSIAGGTTSVMGDNTTGTTNGTSNYQKAQAQKVVATDSGPVIDISAYFAAVDSFCPNIQMGIYADNGSGTAPGTQLGTTTYSAAAAGWVTKALTTTVNITSGTTYWIGLYTNCDDTTRVTTGTGTRYFLDSVSGGLPSSFAGGSSGSGRLAMYATIDTSNNASDSFGGTASIFTLGETGDATFKGSLDSSSAFQVQNSAGSDMLSVNTDTANGATNVQVGDGNSSGTPTLLTLDKASSAPTVQSALLGSMYYDTTLGKVQCYEADGWGACGAAPDTFVTISPEYTNAVMNGTDIGTITSDLCSDTLNINDATSGQNICGTNETYNFYRWTSAETTDQTRGIFVTYQLPSNFKGFVAGSTSLMGKTNSSDSSVSYQIYRDHGSGLTSCGTVSVSTGTQSTWQKAAASGGSDPSTCGFVAGDSILFRINLTAKNNAQAYVSNLGFTFSNN